MKLIRRSTFSSLGPRLGTLIALAAVFNLRLQAAAAGGLPWEKPMTAIATSLTGPVAYAIGLIGIAIAGGAMLWGGELTEFGRRACMIGLVVSCWSSRRRYLPAHSASTRRWCSHAEHRQAERNRDPSVGKPTEPNSRRRS
jgi:type IV secretion system protein VirB2